MKSNQPTGIILTSEMKELLTTFNKHVDSVYMHFLKHLNRHSRWKFEIPEWKIDKWETRYIVNCREFPGIIDNRKAEKIMQLEENKLGNDEYQIVYTVYDKMVGKLIKQGLCKNRHDLWHTYIENMQRAVMIRKSLTGVDTIIENVKEGT
jgi:hypothetical protein